MRYKDYSRAFIGFLFVFLLVMVMLFMKTKSIDEKNSKSYSLLESVYKIELLYHEVQSVVSNELSYVNYDSLNSRFEECDRLIGELENSKELLMLSNEKYRLNSLVASLRDDFSKKREAVESFKALNAVAANSTRYLKSDPQMYGTPNMVRLLTTIFTVSVDKSIDTASLAKEIEALGSSKGERMFKIHGANILRATEAMRGISLMFAPDVTPNLELKKGIIYRFGEEQKADKLIKNYLYAASFAGVLVLGVLFLFFEKNKKELYKFHYAIDKSDAFVAMTDFGDKVTYANDVFTAALGKNKLLGESIFSIFDLDCADSIKNSLKLRVPYVGEAKIHKGDTDIQLKLTAIGIYEGDTLVSILYMGMDITKEKKLEENLLQMNKNLNILVEDKVLELKQKDIMILQQSRFSAMAEAISSIAHQWRQPLNALGIIVQDIKMASDYGELTKEYLDESVSKSKDIILEMSKTIDSFRGFMKSGQEREVFDISFAAQKAVLLSDSAFKNSLVKLEIEYPKEPIFIDGYLSDFVQSMLGILMNSKENFDQNQRKDPKTKITIKSDEEFVSVYISDNGGGCSQEVLDNIFEPYFSTKGSQSGTGIGLFLAKTAIEKNMNGKVSAYNDGDGLTVSISVPVYHPHLRETI